MEKINVAKEELLVKLKENREIHKNEYEGAVLLYRKKLIEVFNKKIREVESGKEVDVYITVTEPIDKTEEYDDAIAMIGMHSGTHVLLSHKDFRCYVLDKWDWAANAKFSNTVYMNRGK